MNKPATKEPSMDEILSSIRQIIADDDAAAAPAPVPKPAPQAAAIPPRPVMPPTPPASPAPSAPLTLSPAQIVRRDQEAPPVEDDFAAIVADLGGSRSGGEPDLATDEPELVDPEDVAFEADEPPPAAATAAPMRRADPAPEPPRSPPRSVAQAAPMPDPRLSADMAEQLLAPATDAAVQANIARLSAMSSPGLGSITVEAMMRDMLRPMLKDWLDENLPALVERMVEKEIARISRGVK